MTGLRLQNHVITEVLASGTCLKNITRTQNIRHCSQINYFTDFLISRFRKLGCLARDARLRIAVAP